MQVTLTNGKCLRISWRHIDASQLRDVEKDDVLWEKLKQLYPTQAEVWSVYERVHGLTECYLMEPAGDGERPTLMASSLAMCSTKDKYHKEKARKLTLTRALGKLPLCKAERQEIWEAYRRRNG